MVERILRVLNCELVPAYAPTKGPREIRSLWNHASPLYLDYTNLRQPLELESVSLQFQINNTVFRSICVEVRHSYFPKQSWNSSIFAQALNGAQEFESWPLLSMLSAKWYQIGYTDGRKILQIADYDSISNEGLALFSKWREMCFHGGKDNYALAGHCPHHVAKVWSGSPPQGPRNSQTLLTLFSPLGEAVRFTAIIPSA